VRLADAPDLTTVDGATFALSPALLRGDPRLEALFLPFQACVALHESRFHEGAGARASRLLMAELRDDRFDELRDVVRAACPRPIFEEKPTELDDVAAGTEWQSPALAVSLYRLFGGSTALHVTSVGLDPADAPMKVLLDSPLAIVGELVEATSFVVNVSCSRSARSAPRWHVEARLRDLRRFEEIAPRIVALGFEERRGKYWCDECVLQALGKDRWMAAMPSSADFGR
jgi:hypothetical protein